jgi:putative tryptophan/tyrosine transport system substrate-binding protein
VSSDKGREYVGEDVKKKATPILTACARLSALSAMHFALCLVGAMLLAPCFFAHAQQPASKIPRIGYLALGFPTAGSDALRQGLKELGYVEGETIIVERRSAEGKEERLADLASELVQLKVDVIVVGGTRAARAARRVTKTIPIVVPDSADPVRAGLVKSLARPGGNITGLTIMSPRLGGKRLELLKEAFPWVSQVAVVTNITSANRDREPPVKDIIIAAQPLGMQVQVIVLQELNEIEGIFSLMARKPVQAFIVIPTPLYTYHGKLIVDMASRSRLPGIYPHRGFVEAGGLMSYAANNADLFRRAASYVDKILKGANPADLPVEQPTKFELVVNLQTARQIGVTIPPEVLMWADEVIR